MDFWTVFNIAPGSIDYIVHSGDFCPNFSRGIRAIEEPRQEQWLRDNADRISAWLKNIPVLFVPGNHDFVDIPKILNDCGLSTIIDICKKDSKGKPVPVDFMGKKIYGSPWVPYFTGEWNYELEDDKEELAVKEVLSIKPDIIVSHSPIYGVLDRNGQGTRCGSRQWKWQLEEQMLNGYVPAYYLHGHIHESNGIMRWKGIVVSNAATTANVIEII